MASCACTDAGTGSIRWTAALPAGSVGIPAMYELNGRQFLVVNATQPIGGRGVPQPPGTARPGAYVAFALPERK